MSKEENPAVILSILKAVYSDVFGIAEYMKMLQMHSREEIEIFKEGDAERFQSFLRELLVCIPWGTKKFPTPISFLQMSTQREVVARVIQRICEKKKKNVLAFGYGLVDKENSLRIMFAPTICSFFPNPTTATVGTSALWETLLSRVGDNVMMHLLENCSLFMIVPPTCCYQISGLPLYNLSSEDTIPPIWFKQSSMLFKNNVLYHCVQEHSKCSTISTAIVKASPPAGEKIGKLDGIRGYQPSDTGIFAPKPKSSKRPSDLDISQCTIPVKKCRMALQLNKYSLSEENFAVGHPRLDMQHASLRTPSQKQNLIEQDGGPFCFPQRPLSCASFERPAADSLPVKDFIIQSTSSSCFLASTTLDEADVSKMFIDFGKLLYSQQVSKEGFLKNFLLNKLAGTSSGSLNLIETVFLKNSRYEEYSHLEVAPQSVKNRKFPYRYWQMRHVFQELIQNHKKCPYMTLLKRCCPVTVKAIEVDKHKEWNKHKNSTLDVNHCHSKDKQSFRHLKNNEDDELQSVNVTDKILKAMYAGDLDMLPLLKEHNSTWQVYMFSRECLNSLVPEKIWGSSHNKCRFLKNVKKIVYSAKSGKMCLSELMWKMRVEDCLWLRLKKDHHFVPASEHLLREKILSKFLYWLMDTYVIQLLKAFFYITETMFQKNKLFYYRKYIWKKLHNIGIRKHFQDVKLHLLSPAEMISLQQKKNNPLVSTLRFIPKANGLRPIAKAYSTMAAEQNREIQLKKIHQFNTQVRNVFSILNFKRSKSSEIVGSSVFGLDEIYKKWKTFVLGNESNAGATFYFVKTDVKVAYDTIPHSKLQEVITKILNPDTEEVYCIRRYAILWMDSYGRIRKSFKQNVSTFIDFMPNMGSFLTQLQECGLAQSSILVEQNLYLNESSSKILSFFQEMISNHILRINNKYFVQCCGIPQGSMLSALLCSLCYGDLESKVFYGVQKNGILMRLIDDFLLVTPNLEQAKTFLRTLADGIPEYGCFISLNKTVVNFLIDDIQGCEGVKQLPAHALFSWCGLLLDTQTLEVFCDYSRYSCTSVQASLTFGHYRATGSTLRRKLLRVLQLKCHSLFFDLKINSLRSVCINAYKILLLQAYRFHACILQLPFGQSLKKNPSFFLTVISEMAPCVYTLFIAKNKDIGTKDATGLFPFELAQYLCYHAFITKLSNHKASYKCLLGSLQHCKIKVTKRLPDETISLLKAVTHPSLHKEFTTIRD